MDEWAGDHQALDSSKEDLWEQDDYSTRTTIEYLRMDVDYIKRGVFAVSMIPFIDKIKACFPEVITRSSMTPHNEILHQMGTGNKHNSSTME